MNTPAREILKCLCIIGLIFTSLQLSAQNSVGIGTNTPNTNSVLELVSTGNNQGFLMPRMTTVQRTDATFTSGLTTTENGLMVFDTDEGAVYFWFNGSWVNTTTLLAGTGIQITGNTIENIGDTDASDDITTATVAAGDVTGDFANLSVAGIQGQPVSNTVPTLDYVLKWDGSQWLPQPDAGNVYTAGTGIDVTGTVITNTGDTDATDDLTTASTAAGDVSGDFSTLQVTGIQGNAVDAGAPATGNILKWDGTQWLLSADNDAQNAASVPFDDAVAVLGATDVQSAIEALDAAIDGLSTGDMNQATYDTDANGIVDFAEDANTINGGLTVDTAVPVGADFTDDQTATDVPVTATGNLTSTDVQSALVELQTDIDGATGDMTQATYDVDANGTVDLAEDANTVNGGLTVETAVPVGASFTDNQTAGDVAVTPTGNLTSADVQSALVELQTDIDGAAGDMTQATYDVGSNGIVDNAELVNGLTVLTAVPAGALFTDNELPGTAATGEILEWNGAAWVAAPNSSFTVSDGTTILGDGDITPLSVGAVAPSLLTAGGATTGQILEYDGANWVPVAPSFVATTDGTSILGDGDITPLSVGAVAPSIITAGGATTGQILEYDGLNWIPVNQNTITVSDGTSILGDGDITPLSVGAVAPSVITAGGATTGQILEYDGLNWIPVNQNTITVSDGTSILGDGDITPLSVGAVAPSLITAGGATTGQILEYDGLNWIPVTQSTATVSDGTSILGDGDITPLSVGAVAPSLLTDGGATTGQILEYDGLNWIPVTQSTATVSDGTSILGDGDITPLSVGAVAPSLLTDGGATTGQILEYDGLNWIPVTQSTATVSDGTSILGDGDITPLSVGAVAPSVITDGGATTGQILEYDGLNWVPVTSNTLITANEIPRGDGAGQVSSNLFSDGTNIGLGQAAPVSTFHIATDNHIISEMGDLIISDNIHLVGGNPTYTENGRAVLMAISSTGGDVQFFEAPTGVSGNTASITNTFTINGTGALSYGSFQANEGITVAGDLTTAQLLSLGDADNSALISFRAPDVMASPSVTFTLPDGDGTANQVLTTDGAGVLSWQNNDGFVNSFEIPKGTGSGLTSSDIYSNGTNQITIGSPTAIAGVKFAVHNQGSPLFMGLTNYSNTATDGSNIGILRARGTEGAEATLQSGDVIGSVGFNVWDGSSTHITSASIRATATSNHTFSTDYGTQLSISTTADGQGVDSERIRIQNDGSIVLYDNTSVGNGPTSAVKLQITPDAGQNNAFRINPESGGTNTGEFQMMELSVNGTNFVGLKAADNIANTRVYTWPDADGTPGQFLTTDGAGIMTWTSAGSFNTTNEIPRGDGAGLVSSNIFSDGVNVAIGSGTFNLPLSFSVIKESGGANTSGIVNYSGTAADDGSTMALVRARGTDASPLDVQNGDRIGTLSYTTHSGGFFDAATIQVTAAENHAAGVLGSTMSFRTAAIGETSNAQRLLINQNGDVEVASQLGVGVIPSSFALDVLGDINFSGSLHSGGTGILNIDDVNNNVALGAGANVSLTSGSNNTALGDNALFTNATGIGNTAIGSAAGNSATGGENTFIGRNAGNATTGNNNVFVGSGAGQNVTAVTGLTFVGYNAGQNNTAINSVLMGYQAGINNQGANNTLIGYNSGGLSAGITGSANTALGGNTGANLTTGVQNTFLGYNAGNAVTTGTRNTFVGMGAAAINDGTDNVAIGRNAASTMTGNSNIIIGSGSSTTLTSGGSNVIIGTTSGTSLATVTTSVGIGANAQVNGNNSIAIGEASTAGNANSIAIGQGAQANGSGGIAIGAGNSAQGARSVVIGDGVSTSQADAVVIGGAFDKFLGINIDPLSDIHAHNSTTSSSLRLTNASTGTLGTDGFQISIGSVVSILNRETSRMDFGTNGTTEMTIDADGDVGIGTITPSGPFHVNFGIGQMFVTANNNQQFGVFDLSNSGTGAAAMRFEGTGQSTTMGIDQSDANKFKINMGTTFAGGETFTITPAGNVGILDTNPLFTLSLTHDNAVASGGLSLQNSAGGENVSLFVNNTTSDLEFHANNGAVILGRILNSTGAYEQLSDRRAKKNFESTGSVLADINKVNITKYHYKRQDDSEIKQIGVVAQELKEIFPSLVSYDEQKDIYTVNYAGLAPVTVKAIQELNTLILAQKDEIEILRSQIASKDVQLNKLENDVSAIKAALGLDNKTSEK